MPGDFGLVGHAVGTWYLPEEAQLPVEPRTQPDDAEDTEQQ